MVYTFVPGCRRLILQGEICDIDGTCVDAADDEIFKLTTKEGSLSMEREKVNLILLTADSNLSAIAIFKVTKCLLSKDCGSAYGWALLLCECCCRCSRRSCQLVM